MPAQPAGDVREYRVPVFEFDAERRARKDLRDRAEEFERGFLCRRVFVARRLRGPWPYRPTPPGYERTVVVNREMALFSVSLCVKSPPA